MVGLTPAQEVPGGEGRRFFLHILSLVTCRAALDYLSSWWVNS